MSIIPVSDAGLFARAIVDKHCSRWSQARKDALREEIEEAISELASHAVMENERYG